MGAKRPLAIVTADPEVEESARRAAELAADSVGPVRVYRDRETFEQVAPRLDGAAVLDPALFAPDGVHEWTLSFLRSSKTLVFLLSRGNAVDADALARFVGAQGALGIPVDPAEMAERLAQPFGGRPNLPEGAGSLDESDGGGPPSLEEVLSGKPLGERESFVQMITDPETGLFKATLWEYRLDEEYKRAIRFRFPLGLVAFSFDGEADEGALLGASGLILTDTRDVDIVGRLDSNTFVALLPHTGPAGTEHFAYRVSTALRQQGLCDLLGEPLDWTVSMAVGPDTTLANSEAFLRKVLAGLSQLSA